MSARQPASSFGGEWEAYLQDAPIPRPEGVDEDVDSPSDLDISPPDFEESPLGPVFSPSPRTTYDPTAPIRTDDCLGCSFNHSGIWPVCEMPAQWGGVEFLYWWRKGRRLPPLVTDGPIAPGVNILFGNGFYDADAEPGGRVSLGYWLDDCQRVGIGGRLWGLGDSSIAFNQASQGAPVLARPFTNTNNNPATADAFLVATAGQAGQIDILSDSNVYGADIFLRKLIAKQRDSRLDIIVGYQFTQIDEAIRISTQNAIGGNQTFTAFDNFEATNEFHGGTLGLWAQHERGAMTVDFMAKVAFGSMREVVRISGGSNGASPNAGLLAQATNIGEFVNNEFTAVPEIGLTCSWHLTQHLDCSLGYSMLYWSHVVQPGDIIDLNVDPTAGAGATTPAFAFDSTDYWVQGLSVGLNWIF